MKTISEDSYRMTAAFFEEDGCSAAASPGFAAAEHPSSLRMSVSFCKNLLILLPADFLFCISKI